MFETGLFFLLLLALVIGWYLGRRDVRCPASVVDSEYVQGLNYLLNEQPDTAIESFIDSLPVNNDTFELHIALGNLLRDKGEVDRAIRIHQNLLARQGLTADYKQKSHFELAKDYIAAGLMDRAERLLVDLAVQEGGYRDSSLRCLVDLYQQESEWHKAISTVKMLMPRLFSSSSFLTLRRESRLDPELRQGLAHYHCELADQCIRCNDFRAARKYLRDASQADQNCPRVYLLLAELELKSGEPAKALKALRIICDREPEFIPEALPLIDQSYLSLSDMPGRQRFLSDLLSNSGSSAVVLALIEQIECDSGKAAAAEFLREQLKVRSTLRVSVKLLAYLFNDLGEEGRVSLVLLQDQLSQLLLQKPGYRCQHCGFSGVHLHWLCPSCKQWGTVRPVRGVEGD
jgi:lipopolysaccharide biosynthesis regulator YciM